MADEGGKKYSYMNAAEVMDTVFDIYKKSFFSQVGMNFCVYTIGFVVLYLFLILFTIAGIYIGSFFSGMFGAVTGGFGQPGVGAIIVAASVVFIWLVLIYINTVASATCFLSWLSFSGGAIRVSFALNNTFKSFGRIITVSLAQAICGAPAVLLAVLAIYALFSGQGVFTADYWLGEGLMSLMSPPNIFLLTLIIIAGWFAISAVYNFIALALPIAVFDRKHFFSAVVGSYRIIKGHFWLILGMRTVFFGVGLLISYSFTGLFALFQGVTGGLSGSFAIDLNGIRFVTTVLQYITVILAAVLRMPLNGIFTAVIYFNQKIKKDGLDLVMKLSELERLNGF